MNLKSLLPDFGQAGFYKGFLKFLSAAAIAFVLGGLDALVPFIQTFFSQFNNSQLLQIGGMVIGGVLWLIHWIKSKTEKPVVTGTELA